jgi:hypothetical protein
VKPAHGTAPAVVTGMRRSIFIAFALVAGCTCPPDQVDHYGYAPVKTFKAQIDACMAAMTLKDQQPACQPLCDALFPPSGDEQPEFCTIIHQDSDGSVRVWERVDDYTSCSADSSGDVTIDDGTDDGSTDDGSTDDGSDDGSDDSSTDDGSTDDSSSMRRVPARMQPDAFTRAAR